MKTFGQVLFFVMGILNVLGGFVTGEVFNIVMGTAFVFVAIFYYRKRK